MNTTTLRHPIQHFVHGNTVCIERRAVPRIARVEPRPVFVRRVAMVLQRLQRLGAQNAVTFPAAALEHMHAGIREWTDDETPHARTSSLFDALVTHTGTTSPQSGLGSSW